MAPAVVPFICIRSIKSHKRNKRTADERRPIRREVTSTFFPAYPVSPAVGQHQQCCIRRPPRGMSTLCCSSPYVKQEVVNTDHHLLNFRQEQKKQQQQLHWATEITYDGRSLATRALSVCPSFQPDCGFRSAG
jgi:hypothetical protein